MRAHVVGKAATAGHGATSQTKGLRNGYGRLATDDDSAPPTVITREKGCPNLKSTHLKMPQGNEAGLPCRGTHLELGNGSHFSPRTLHVLLEVLMVSQSG